MGYNQARMDERKIIYAREAELKANLKKGTINQEDFDKAIGEITNRLKVLRQEATMEEIKAGRYGTHSGN